MAVMKPYICNKKKKKKLSDFFLCSVRADNIVFVQDFNTNKDFCHIE